MSSKSPRQKQKRRTEPMKPAQRTEPASMQPEELSAEEPAELAVEFAARERRGRPPPSI
jgi:hypothetical protein